MDLSPDSKKTKVVNIKNSSFDVYIGRGKGCRFGNPFKIGQDGSRADVIKKYEKWILNQPDVLKLFPKLRGKKLGCYCSPLACHGNIIVKLLNEHDDDWFLQQKVE